MNLGSRIVEQRNKIGVSQEALAQKLGVSRPYLSYVENGVKTPSLAQFMNIAEALNVSAEWLLFGDRRNLTA